MKAKSGKRALWATVTALAVSTVFLAHAVSAEGRYYFRKGPGLITLKSGADNGPGDGSGEEQPQGGPLALSLDLPEEMFAETSLTAGLAASGGKAGAVYTFAATAALPGFASLLPDGTLNLDPLDSDVGEYSIAFSVSDGVSTVPMGPVTLVVSPLGTAAFKLPETVKANGQAADRSVVFDGDASTALNAAGGLSMTYAKPVAASGAFVSAQGYSNFQLTLEAKVGSQWKAVATGFYSGSMSGVMAAADGRLVSSREWRVVPQSIYGVSVSEFRPGDAPANPRPVLTPSGGVVAVKGQTVQVAGLSPSAYYSSSPVTFALAEGQTPPSGVIVSADGTVAVSPTAGFSDSWTFNLVATDGSGFKTTGTFAVNAEAPLASTVIAKDFSFGGQPVDFRKMYDGDTAPAVDIAPGQSMTVDFGQPVKFSAVRFAFTGLSTARLEYDSSGQWLDSGATAAVTYVGNSIDVSSPTTGEKVARRMRLTNVGTGTMRLAELRIGSGNPHTGPAIAQSGRIATLGDDPQSVSLTATKEMSYVGNDGPVTFSIDPASNEPPEGSFMHEDGTFDLPALADVSGFSWNVSVRATDPLGFYSVKQLQVDTPAVSASLALPVSVTKNGVPVNPASFYDNTDAGYYPVNVGDVFEFDYGRQVKFRAAATRINNKITVQYEAGGSFIGIPTPGSQIGAGTSPCCSAGVSTMSSTVLTTQKIRITANPGGFAEFRLSGDTSAPPAQAAPTISLVEKQYLETLEASPKTVQLTATWAAAQNYPAITQRRFVLLSSELPGVTVSESGLLSLPAASGSSAQKWLVGVRAIDYTGFWVDRQFYVGQNLPNAADVMASKVVWDGKEMSAAQRKLLYDEFSQFIVNRSGGYIDVEFPYDVLVDSVFFKGANKPFVFYADPGYTGGYVAATVVAANPANASPGKVTAVTKVAARRFRLKYSDDYYDMTVYAFRVGGGALPAPVFGLPANAVVGSLDAVPTTVQLAATPAGSYGASGPIAWSISAATPALAGLSITSDGVLNLPARPAAAGPWTFTATITDAAGFKAKRIFTVN